MCLYDIICKIIFNYEGKKQMGPAWSRYCFIQNLKKANIISRRRSPNFDLSEEKVYPYFKENKHGVFDWGLPGANADLFDNFNW